jgi:hypothetical protein
LIESPEFSQRHRFAEHQFTRHRRLPVAKLVMFLLNLVQGALQAELDRFFELVQGVGGVMRLVSKAAFCVARRKLHFGAFVEVNRTLVDAFYTEQVVERWQGWRLLAVDGSTALLPSSDEITQWFGVVDPAEPRACPIGRVSTLYDALNRIVVDAHLAPYRIGERDLVVEHLRHVRTDDLLLLDRGYGAFWLLALFRALGVSFCMRVAPQFSPALEQFVRTGKTEGLVELCAGRDARRQCRSRGLSLQPMLVRAVRVELNSGEIEVLITSLRDGQLYPSTCFADLYHRRWGIEEGYKVLKCRVECENFTGKSVLSVMQDFHARVVSTNLTVLLTHQAQREIPKSPRRHPLRVNFSHALSRMRNAIVRLLVAANPRALVDTLIETFRRTTEPVRPQRAFPRIFYQTARRFRATYKRCG